MTITTRTAFFGAPSMTIVPVAALIYNFLILLQISLLQLEVTWYKIRQTGTQKNLPDCKTEHKKLEKCNISLFTFPSGVLSHSFALQYVGFCTICSLAANGLLGSIAGDVLTYLTFLSLFHTTNSLLFWRL